MLISVQVFNYATGRNQSQADTDSAKQSYLQGCEDVKNTTELFTQDKLNKYCGCTWDYLINRYSIKEIIDINVKYTNTGKTPSELVGAARSCVWTVQ